MSIRLKWIFSILFFLISLYAINWNIIHQNVFIYINKHPLISHLATLPSFVYGLFGGR